MRILFLSQYFYPEQFLNNHIAAALVERGHKVDVFCCVPNYPSGRFFNGYSNFARKRETWNGVTINRVTTIPRGKRKFQLLLNYLCYPLTASVRLALRSRHPYDVSFVSMPSPLLQGLVGILAKRIYGIPTVFWVQDIWPDSAIITLSIRNRAVIAALNAVCGWIYRQADLVLVQSDGFHDRIEAFGVDAQRILTLPNTAPAIFRPIAREAIAAEVRALIPHDRRVLMFAGNIGQSQDFDTIIAAAALLPGECNLLIVVVGSGRDEDRVRSEVMQRGLAHRFLFVGRHPEESMPMFFACADAMLVSLKDEPIFALTVPSKVQSYMACGKPIVASLAGEGAAIVSAAGAGFTVSPSCPEALSQAFMCLASTPRPELAEMSANARQAYLGQFALEAVSDKLINFLTSVARAE